MNQSISLKNVEPAAGYVLVEPAQQPKQTASGIYLPDSKSEKPQYGTVLSIGAPTMIEGTEMKSPVKKGAQVIYKKWGGNDFKIGDTEYQFLKFDDILATISK